MENNVCSNAGPCHFPRGDDSENILTNFKNHLLMSQTKYNVSLGDGNLTLNEWGPWSFQSKDNIVFLIYQHCGLILSCAKLFIDWNWYVLRWAMCPMGLFVVCGIQIHIIFIRNINFLHWIEYNWTYSRCF